MTVPSKYVNTYLPVKHFLNSYRALSDGRTALRLLEEQLLEQTLYISEWKVNWIAACTLLRSAIDLFQQDKKACFSQNIRAEIDAEWRLIGENKDTHTIFWEFLRKERDSIIHFYEWAAYEVWMNEDGKHHPARLSLLDIKPEDARSVLIMRHGYYKGKDSVELLKKSATWVEERIFSAIERAGFSPDEERNIVTYTKRPPLQSSLLGNQSMD